MYEIDVIECVDDLVIKEEYSYFISELPLIRFTVMNSF